MKSKVLFFIMIALAMPVASRAATCSSISFTPTPVSFGNYNGTAINSNGSVQVFCTFGGTLPSYTIAINAGDSNSFMTRQMDQVLGTSTLSYNIYTTASFATVWGNGTGGSVMQTYSAGSGLSTITYTAYGNLPSSQLVPLGAYSDALTVTVTF